MRFLRVFCYITLVLLSACAPTTQRIAVDSARVEEEARKQREIAVEDIHADRMRLYKVTYPLITKAHALCGDKTDHILGAVFINRMAFGKEFREATSKVFDVQDAPKVALVMPDSPAERAGLRVGDVVSAVNGISAKSGDEEWAELIRKMNESIEAGTLTTLEVRRAGAPISVTVEPQRSCAFRSFLANQDVINAAADGKKILVTRGMMRFVRDDSELALVIGHELAHNAMGHIDAKRGNFALGTILDVLAAAYGVNTQGMFGNAAASAYSQDFEAEADYVGLYMMATAGFELNNAPQFWRRMAVAHPSSIRGGGMMASHPASPERFVSLEEAIKEIRTKQASGAPLQPELKKAEPAEPMPSGATP
ncbi:MAG TPA: M48 family metalloprotease [Burkholderiales bacterium]|nr:M48 family metalloprotease [Burkholderiales bacterium]